MMNSQHQDILASLEVMRMQEESAYQCSDYFFEQQQQQESTSSGAAMPQHVDAECRYKMADWCFQVVDFCKFNRETVSISMSFLDRYLSTPTGASRCLSSKKEFQLAAMTALYTAVKINEPEAMDPKVIAGLSRGVYTEDQVTDMELSILNSLKWRMNPPTALSFVRAFFQLLPTKSIPETVQEAAFELARFQTELAISDYQYCTCKASTIAVAALLNSFEGLEHQLSSETLPKQYLQEFVTMMNVQNVNELHQVQNALYASISKANDSGKLPSKFSETTTSSLQEKKQEQQQKNTETIAQQSSPRSIRDQGTMVTAGCMQ